MNRISVTLALVCLLAVSNIAAWAQELRVLPESIDGGKKSDMMYRYLRELAGQFFQEWKNDYEQRKAPEQITEYQRNLRQKFLQAIGEFPERTPLNPKITGIIQRDGYRVEKVIFESQPAFYVTALLFMPDPDKHKPPFPGVIVPCGHSQEGKGYPAYQSMGALLAINGMAALVFDPIDQGERGQYPAKWPALWGTKAHTMLGVGSILLGRNTAWFEIWDGMRTIDYLQSRQEIDRSQIGCTGCSGGGTQTSYLMSLDDRIKAAAPSCYITNFYERILDLGAQDAEQNIFGQLRFKMDHADYLTMRAPTPILICAATQDFFDIRGTWQSFRYAKRLYTRFGYPERIDLLENDEPHNYSRLHRQGVARWMARWLLNRDDPITEPDIKLLSEQEYICTPDGQVMNIAGARSGYDINRELEQNLAEKRRKLWRQTDASELRTRVSQLAGIRPMARLSEPQVEQTGRIQRHNCTIEKLILKTEPGIYLPALCFIPEKTASAGTVLCVHEDGKTQDVTTDGPVEKLVAEDRIVLAVDLRGTGETQQMKQDYFWPDFGPDGQDVYTAYLLGRSYVGMRAEDILVCARYLQKRFSGQVDLVASGHVTIPALHAAALETGLFGSVKLIRGLSRYSDVIQSGVSFNQLVTALHGVLAVYDLPDLRSLLANKVTVEEPLDPLDQSANRP